jgi:adenylate cyclase
MDASDGTAGLGRGPLGADASLAPHDRSDGHTDPIILAHATPFRLGALSIVPGLRRVSHDDGREAILEPRVMQVLVALARAGGGIVTREALTHSCWRGVVVGEDALSRVVGRVRRLTKGVGAGSFELETITKVGYRLVAPGLAQADPRTETPPREPQGAVARPSICVLPFENMSDDPQQAYFSDGVTEDIITDLSKVSALFVVARTTAFSLKDTRFDAPQLARRLGVGHLLEGSVRTADGRVRITAQLIDGATGGHVWAERYDRDLRDIFALQDEISQAIVAALRLRLLPEEKKAIGQRGTTMPEAYTLYLQARRYYRSGREGDRRSLEAIERLCRRAAEIDPRYARAWELLAFAQTSLNFDHGLVAGDGLAAAERALALDTNLAEAHAVRAWHLIQQDRDDEAFAEIQIALSVDPDSWAANSEAGCLSYRRHRFEDAIAHFEKATALGQLSASDPGMMMSSYAALGDREGMQRAARITLARAERALEQGHVNGAAMGCAVGALAVLGQAARARDIIERSLLIDPDNMKMRYNFGCGASSQLHDPDVALELLAPVFETMSASFLNYARTDPDLDPIRDDPRFRAMVAAAETRLAAET